MIFKTKTWVGLWATWVIMISACAVMPQSFDQQLAAANIAFTGAVRASTTALQTQVISLKEAQELRVLMEQAKTILDSSKVIADAGDTSSAEAKLLLATGIISEIQTYLLKEQKNERGNNDDDSGGSGSPEANNADGRGYGRDDRQSTTGRPHQVERV